MVATGPKAEIPQALVGGGVAPAGAAAAAIAPPTSASDPATLTALLRILFTGVPFIGDVTALSDCWGASAAAVPALACSCGPESVRSGLAPAATTSPPRSLIVIKKEHTVTVCESASPPQHSSAVTISQVIAGPADYCHDRSRELLRAARPGVPLRPGRHSHRQRVPARHRLARRVVPA